MHGRTIMIGLFVLSGLLGSARARADEGDEERMRARRPVATYSIVARDARTSELGVAVQSHWFSVGSIVPWAEAGVGAVATQSLVDPAYGPLGLELMRDRADRPRRAARPCWPVTTGRDGPPGGHDRRTWGGWKPTRARAALPTAGHVVDADNCSSRYRPTSWRPRRPSGPPWPRAYRESTRATWPTGIVGGPGGRTGNRRRHPRQAVGGTRSWSSATSTGKSWDRPSLRPSRGRPPASRSRSSSDSCSLQRAYLHMNAGDAGHRAQRLSPRRCRQYAAARQGLAPQIVEIPFWHAVTLVSTDRVDDALPLFRDVFAREPVWLELLPRLVDAGLLPQNPAILDQIRAQAP